MNYFQQLPKVIPTRLESKKTIVESKSRQVWITFKSRALDKINTAALHSDFLFLSRTSINEIKNATYLLTDQIKNHIFVNDREK